MGRASGDGLDTADIVRAGIPQEPLPLLPFWLVSARDDLPDEVDPWSQNVDKTSAVVVRAATEKEARQLASTCAMDEGKQVWLLPTYTKATKLDPTGKPAVILSEARSV